MHAGYPNEISGVGYFIPNDNPWNDPGGSVFEEFYEIGHRNPYRMTIDPPTGETAWATFGGGDVVNVASRLESTSEPGFHG